MLTASADTGSKFVGTEKGDVFKADSFVSATGNYLPTLNSSDELDGGAGKDTLNITVETNTTTPTAYTMATASIKNIETITIKGADDVTADVSGSNITGLETISVLKSIDATVTAAATTDVNVSGATGVIKVDGGKNVVVNDATADQNITIGATTGAAGTITVTDTKQGTGVIAVDGGTDVTVTATAADISTGTTSTTGAINIGQDASAILPTGDVKVTQNLEFDGNDAGAAGTTTDLTGGAITISGGKTVDVTVNANNVAKVATAANDIVVGTITVKGGDNTTTVTVTQNDNTETFTSAEVAEVKDTQTITFKALTSGQDVTITDGTNVLTFTASKDLTAEEVAAAFAELVAADRQDNGGKVANGVYEGQFAANWSAKSVSGATVTFEAPVSNTTTLADTGSSVAQTVGTVVNGTAASGGVESLNSVQYGQVVINNSAKTTGATDAIKTVTVDGYATASTIASNALTDVTLKNSAGTMTVNSTVATLNVTLDNVNHTVDLDGATSGVATLKTLNLTSTGEASDITLDAKGVETLTIAAAADLDVSGSTLTALKTVTVTGAGDVTLGNLSTVTTFTTLTASAATGDITAEVDADVTVTTGSGNDTITVTAANTTTAISKAIDLGAGDDTLVLTDDTTVIPTAAIAGGAGTDTISMTFTSADEFDINTNFAATISGFERLEISDAFLDAAATQETLILDMEKLGFNYVITNGTGTSTLQDKLKLNNLAANATVELNANGLVTAALKTATGATDEINVVTNVATAAVDFGTFTVASVETVNITVNDTQLDDNSDDVIDSTNDIVEVAILNLTADAAKTVNVTGTSSLTLDTVSTTITKVNAADMTGNLTYTADGATAGTEVIAGSGNDTLRASGENDVLKGNAGSDTFYAGDLTTVYGGEGADKFYFAIPTQLAKVATIADLGSGDTIYLTDKTGNVNTADAVVSKFYAAGANINVNTATTFESKVDASLVQTGAGEATWFQHGGNTYIVIDGNDSTNPAAGAIDSYTAGQDTVIEITGTVNLSTASFNATTGTLEIA